MPRVPRSTTVQARSMTRPSRTASTRLFADFWPSVDLSFTILSLKVLSGRNAFVRNENLREKKEEGGCDAPLAQDSPLRRGRSSLGIDLELRCRPRLRRVLCSRLGQPAGPLLEGRRRGLLE